jgi:hypothetical protein
MSFLDNPKNNRRFLLVLSLGAVVWVGSCTKAFIEWAQHPVPEEERGY